MTPNFPWLPGNLEHSITRPAQKIKIHSTSQAEKIRQGGRLILCAVHETRLWMPQHYF